MPGVDDDDDDTTHTLTLTHTHPTHLLHCTTLHVKRTLSRVVSNAHGMPLPRRLSSEPSVLCCAVLRCAAVRADDARPGQVFSFN